MKKQTKQFILLFSFMAITLMVGFLGSQLSGGSEVAVVYSELDQPSFSPPAWIFAPVWTILYLLMGISAYLIWRKREKTRIPLTFFFVQLLLNLFWPIIFFGLGQYSWAFVEIVFLWIATLITMKLFFKVSKPAFYLLLPYIIWLTFAGVLNFTILMIN